MTKEEMARKYAGSETHEDSWTYEMLNTGFLAGYSAASNDIEKLKETVNEIHQWYETEFNLREALEVQIKEAEAVIELAVNVQNLFEAGITEERAREYKTKWEL